MAALSPQINDEVLSRPTYLSVYIEAFLFCEELHNVQLVRARGPVDGQTAVVVFRLALVGLDLMVLANRDERLPRQRRANHDGMVRALTCSND